MAGMQEMTIATVVPLAAGTSALLVDGTDTMNDLTRVIFWITGLVSVRPTGSFLPPCILTSRNVPGRFGKAPGTLSHGGGLNDLHKR